MFYGQEAQAQAPLKEEKPIKVLKAARSGVRVAAYIVDLFIVVSVVSLALTAMARAMEMDVLAAWQEFPHEMTPLAVSLFCGIYLMYFSVFENSTSSTLGKNIMGLLVVESGDKVPGFTALLIRSVISLLNFASMGLFSWYDLQGKVTGTKVVRSN